MRSKKEDKAQRIIEVFLSSALIFSGLLYLVSFLNWLF